METNLDVLLSDPRWAALLESMKETDLKMKETAEQIKETGKQMKETDRKMKETYRKIEKLSNLFTTQWGKLIESLCTPAALQVFEKTGIGISQIYRSAARGKSPNGHSMEADVILCDTDVAVVVEVKTTCRVEDVDYFLDQMNYFKECFPRFDDCKVYPAITAINYNEKSDKYALRKGLFVLYPQGDGLFKLEEPSCRCTY